jgi:SSS family solute:Na+ symporter
MTLWIVFMAYLVVVVALGEVLARLKVRSLDDYLLSARQHGTLITSASLVATVIGAGSTLGSAAVAYYVGVSAGWYLVSAGPGLILLAFTLAPVLRRLSVYTVPEYVDRRYGRGAGALAAGLGLIALTLFVSAQFYAMGSLMAELSPLTTRPAIALSAAVVVLYTWRGGNWAIHWSDAIQLVVIVIGVSAVVVTIADRLGGLVPLATPPPAPGFEESGARWFHPITREPVAAWNPFSLGGTIVAWIVMSTTWHFAMQSTAQRILSTRDEVVVRRACLIAAAATLPLGVLFAISGMGARELVPGLEPPGAMEMLEQVRALPALIVEVLSPFWGGFVVAALVAVIMSTSDSALLGAATVLLKDLLPRFGREAGVDEEGVRASRRWVGGIGLVSLGGALVAPGLVQTLELVAAIYGVALFGPLLAGPYWKGATGVGAIASMISSGIAGVVWRTSPLEASTGIHMLNVALPVALVALVLGSFVSGKATAGGGTAAGERPTS